MNKKLFWFGAGFQLIQWSILFVFIFINVIGVVTEEVSKVNLSFVTPFNVTIFMLICFNMASVYLMVKGMRSKPKEIEEEGDYY